MNYAYASGGLDLGNCEDVSFEAMTFFCRFADLGSLISTLLPTVLVIAGLILLVYSIVAGFKIMQAGGSAEDIGQNKTAITAGVFGFLLIFSSVFIIQLIEFLLGIDILSPDI